MRAEFKLLIEKKIEVTFICEKYKRINRDG